MEKLEPVPVDDSFDRYINSFRKLMPNRIRDILLVSSLYDSYILEEDGRLYEMIRREYEGLNLIHAPEVTHVASGYEALQLAKEEHFDVIITTLHIEDMHSITFAKALRANNVKTPIVLLAFDNRERDDLVANYDASVYERIFIWQGDYRLLVAIFKYLEDRMNIENDTQAVGVQTIILIENNVKFYSSYLPLIYTEILKQSQLLVNEGINLTHRYLRMRARPKILLCTNYDEAWAYFEKYSEHILGVISDINFRRGGVRDPEAGIQFVKNVKANHGDIPTLLQSSNAEFAEVAHSIGASFVQKGSSHLLQELRQFILDHFGFGDFIFRLPDGKIVGTAQNLKALEDQLNKVPAESIVYHAERNHFSSWFKARTEFSLANKLRPKRVAEIGSPEQLRSFLINALKDYQETLRRGVITDFEKETYDTKSSFARIGGGSLGGKARGLGFVNRVISNFNFSKRFPGVQVKVPSALVLGTDVFDQFLEENGLLNFALSATDDHEVTRRFLKARYFPKAITRKLAEYLEIVQTPLAVRSSSLLEDSQYQPFAGVYQTYMIPNNDRSPKVRLQELVDTIRRVYASTFHKAAKDYIRATEYRLEEEKMAVVIQNMVGTEHEGRFYPDFAGVAKSYNFYPVAPQKPTDGIAVVALGLGKTVVDGGKTVRFCPKYPRHLMQFVSPKDTLKSAQQDFFALNLKANIRDSTDYTEDVLVQSFDLDMAESDGTLKYSGSTYSAENDSVYDGISRPGRRIVTFAPILKQRVFPLAEVLDIILDLGRRGMGTAIEIEFAVKMSQVPEIPHEFALLQIRPLVLNSEVEELNVDDFKPDEVLVVSEQVLGNGAIKEIYDLVVVDIDKFDRGYSREVAEEVAAFNAKLVKEKRPYVLIGVGRWGTLDQWLGIPVSWDQISGAATIVESSFKDFAVTPSQGSHFFQNLVSFRVGYFTVNSAFDQGLIDWKWLSEQKVAEEKRYTRHLRFDKPLSVRMNGRKNKGLIFKPSV